MGKAKKIGLGFGLGILGFFILILSIGSSSIQENEQELRNMSIVELDSLSVEWSYGNLLRNINDYEGEIIHVSGKVVSSQPDIDTIGIQPSCSKVLQNADCDWMFIITSQNFLVNDFVDGYVKVNGLTTLETTDSFSGAKNTEQVPYSESIKLQCTSC